MRPEGIERIVSKLLRAETASLPENTDELLELIEALRCEGMLPVLYHKLSSTPLPDIFKQALEAETRAQIVLEALLKQETIRVLEAFNAEGIHPLLLKGTAFCYSIYPEPHLRPRTDIDLLIKEHKFAAVREIMLGLGYSEPTTVTREKADYQFPFFRVDSYGNMYQLDIHWKLGSSKFAKIFSYSELYSRCAPVSALGENAFTLSKVDMLIYSCIHQSLHRRQRLIWLYDIHLLLELMSARKFQLFLEEATERDVMEVCAKAIRVTDRFIGSDHIHRLPAERREPKVSTVEHLSTVDFTEMDLKDLSLYNRFRLLCAYLFPSPGYIMRKYRASNRIMLPLLYLHRIYSGIKRWLQPKRA